MRAHDGEENGEERRRVCFAYVCCFEQMHTHTYTHTSWREKERRISVRLVGERRGAR